ncbi:MAG: hypothetical protein LW707_07610 [Sphingobacteriales bacterium]|jgi:hypothetical protein|nr:hypothetical protein [Sphingobacteriales bacterium]
MNRIILSSITFACLTLLFACSPKVPFTQQIREQYKLSPDEMRGIQFYLSDPVVLRRMEQSEREKKTEEGKLVIESGSSLDQLTFKANTPGLVDGVVDASTIKISFEDGAEKYMVFGSARSRNGYYGLQGLPADNGRVKINYAGQSWIAGRGSEQAILLFKMKSVRKLRVNDNVAKGKKL